MKRPKIFGEMKSERESKGFPYYLVFWSVLLVIFLLLARNIQQNQPTENRFEPKVILNSAIVQKSFSENITEEVSEYPQFLGSSNDNDRLLKVTNPQGIQTFYKLDKNGDILEAYEFSRDFSNIKYISGGDYTFVQKEGLFINQSGTDALVYKLKPSEVLQDYIYSNSEKSFYLLLNKGDSQFISKTSVLADQVVFNFYGAYLSPKILKLSDDKLYIRDAEGNCSSVYLLENLTQVELCSNLLENNIVSKDGSNSEKYLQVSSLSASLLLPSSLVFNSYYNIDNTVWVIASKGLLVSRITSPESFSTTNWTNLLSSSQIVSIEFVY